MNRFLLTLSAVLLAACATPHGSGREECTKVQECAASVKAAVERSWKRPEGTALRGLSAELRVTLGEQFEVQSVVVKRSSGNAEFDRSATDAVQTVGKFPELRGLGKNDSRQFRELEFQFRPGAD